MGLLAKQYDLALVVCTVGGVPIGGYGADGGISIEPVAAINEVTVGADNLTVASKVNNSDGIATITLSEMSLGYAALAGFMQTQRLPSPVLIPLPFFLLDPTNGDQMSSANTIFLEPPTIAKNRTASDRVFRVHLPGAFALASFGVLNVV